MGSKMLVIYHPRKYNKAYIQFSLCLSNIGNIDWDKVYLLLFEFQFVVSESQRKFSAIIRNDLEHKLRKKN